MAWHQLGLHTGGVQFAFHPSILAGTPGQLCTSGRPIFLPFHGCQCPSLVFLLKILPFEKNANGKNEWDGVLYTTLCIYHQRRLPGARFNHACMHAWRTMFLVLVVKFAHVCAYRL